MRNEDAEVASNHKLKTIDASMTRHFIFMREIFINMSLFMKELCLFESMVI